MAAELLLDVHFYKDGCLAFELDNTALGPTVLFSESVLLGAFIINALRDPGIGIYKQKLLTELEGFSRWVEEGFSPDSVSSSYYRLSATIVPPRSCRPARGLRVRLLISKNKAQVGFFNKGFGFFKTKLPEDLFLSATALVHALMARAVSQVVWSEEGVREVSYVPNEALYVFASVVEQCVDLAKIDSLTSRPVAALAYEIAKNATKAGPGKQTIAQG